MEDSQTYSFDGYVLDPHRRRLSRDGHEIDLSDRVISVLIELVSRAPEVVGKAELMAAAWPDVAVVEDNLVQAIHTIRATLGGDSRRPRFVKTVHRRGYRFVAPVEVVSREATRPRTPPHPEKAKQTRRKPWAVGAAALSIAAAMVIGWMMTKDPPVQSPPTVRSLAVLPMENLSHDPEQEYFADGMTDALITELARIQSLKVISRTSVMKFKDAEESVPEIARALGVDALVEGTVTRSDGRVRVIAQLVDAGDRHLWGENYESDLRDVLKLQRDLARAIAGEIGARVATEAEAAVSSRDRVDPEALEAYLRGRHVSRHRTEESLRKAVRYFEESIALDPTYAPAVAGLADAHNLLANYGFDPSPAARPRAREAAMRAIELDPVLVDAHVALAVIRGEYDWDFETAENEFQLSLSLSPSNVAAHSRRAQLLVTLGRLDEAIQEMRRAHRLDPLSDIITANLGWFLFLDGQEESAEVQLLEVIDFNPSFAVAHFYLGVLLDRQGRFDEAIHALDRACELSGNSSYAVGALIHALARSGDVARARREMDRLLAGLESGYVSPIGLAVAHFGLGEVDQAFVQLERALTERKGWLLHLRVEPALDPVRDDPRYLDLEERIGLP